MAGINIDMGPVSEICLPNEQARLEILKIHADPIAKHGEIGEHSVCLPVCVPLYTVVD